MRAHLFEFVVATIVVAVMASACAGGPTPTPTTELAVAPKTKVRVVVSIVPLATFAEQVGKDNVKVSIMVPPGASPHTYEPTPSQLVEVSQADMFVKAGSGVEFELAWMDKIIDANKKMLVVDGSEGVDLIAMDEHSQNEAEEHSQHNMDPHIWLSPRNAKAMASNICDGLVQVDQANEAYYVQNKESFAQELDQLDADIRSGLEGIENRRFMVFHPAWGYFARDYDLEQIAVEEAGKEPTAKGIAALVEQAKEHNIKVVFASPQFSPQSARAIANEIGGRVVFIDSLAKDYVSNLRLVLSELAQAME